ncbi:BRICHOS domain-containing protein [Caenorhabditis elegans]|uniref:BRICHOS domain-containing protein n=1 Tax=Caenorhabditis elegans TaxID=6239 RepID=Q17903_CAEEL|nr:BRICHOS domain-containing protein [Caenorhabditis elegans]CAA91973.2 BRICHOS domain-containing protein [Caenorhabditis elegans]|eukprot:NP_510517.2 Uncharacterized protein CELE_C11G10.1 [Caenorhabditis elegans]
MENPESKNQDCGYLCLTITALLIAVFSAGLTLLIASYMYHGSYEPFELPSEVTTSNVKRLIVGHKKVVLFKIDAKNRCYILPAKMSKEISISKFSFVNSPLTQELLENVADHEGVDFCGRTPAFVLEKST